MTIRITGMNSGLDTESIIQELSSVRNKKVESLEKEKTKLTWKQDAWKTLNSKIYALYTDSLDNMRLKSAYSKRTTKVSDSSAVSVITGEKAVNGVQELKIKKLAKTGYLTGAQVTKTTGGTPAGDTTLAEVGASSGTLSLTVNGEVKTVELTADMTLDQAAAKFKEAGVNANFDAATGRFFISSTSSGATADFTITAADSEGTDLMAALGINTQNVTAKSADTYKAEQIAYLKAQLDNETLTEADKDEIRALFVSDEEGNLTDELTEAGEEYVANAYQSYKDDIAYQNAHKATKITGRDAEIELNGATFTSASNTFDINGLTYTATKETGDDIVTISTEQDTSGIYDMIKDFVKKYSELINEMDKLYNAESASKYEPLTDEEKDAMSDTEIEEWEKKIKDSLLRKDTTLGIVSSAMKTIMMEGITVGGKTMHLSDFGIATLSYFTAAENEKNALHIDGNSDDPNTKTNADKLRTAIANDPDTVVDFFSELCKKLYDKLGGLMTSTDYSSAYTVYDDKQMKSDLSDYETKISDAQDELNDYMDKWYSKFSKMETALSKINSTQSNLSSLFG